MKILVLEFYRNIKIYKELSIKILIKNINKIKIDQN